MSIEYVVRARQSRDLSSARLRTLLDKVTSESSIRLSLVGDGVGVRCGATNPVELVLGQTGPRLTITARPDDADIAAWLAHQLAALLRGSVFDPQLGAESAKCPDVTAVRALIQAREALEPGDDELGFDADDVETLIDALVAANAIEVQDPTDPRLSTLVSTLADPVALYEALLAHPAVDEVYIEEGELFEVWKRILG
ncbi:MAG: hypothetical protein HYV07_21670 [Deltaproteobacteria bacterium]|nr:hypothetical protein [Deltaproteobacteria bacterium]